MGQTSKAQGTWIGLTWEQLVEAIFWSIKDGQVKALVVGQRQLAGKMGMQEFYWMLMIYCVEVFKEVTSDAITIIVQDAQKKC